MENKHNKIILHPQILEVLFAFKSKVSTVFNDVIGIHEIDHIAITRINQQNELLSLSSTPALEFNLFSSSLWHYDKTYDPQWFHLCSQSDWPALYHESRYDELYYLKQIKHGLPVGISIATKMDNNFVIYSLASNKACDQTQEIFSNQREDFLKIGQYCSNLLDPLFAHSDNLSSQF